MHSTALFLYVDIKDKSGIIKIKKVVVVIKSKWDEYVKPKLFLIECWKRDGLSDEQICKNLGVGKDAFISYKAKYPELVEALKKGKEVADYEVENALFKRACGYDIDEITTELDGENNVLKTKVIKKHISPDVGAACFWLKNRVNKKWRDRIIETDAETLEKLDEVLKSLDKNMKASGKDA